MRVLNREIAACKRCPRLRAHCEEVARVKRRAYRGETYWGKPVPSFGDPGARLLIVGLAPGAHGANRTGRMFTGDRSGEFLFRALHETGFASQPWARAADDGLALTGAWITAPVHCAPPDNKPTAEEFAACRPFLAREIPLLKHVRVVVALGKLGFDAYQAVRREQNRPRSRTPFGHGVIHDIDPVLITSYHPSQQNTSTGRLTAEMLRSVFQMARRYTD